MVPWDSALEELQEAALEGRPAGEAVKDLFMLVGTRQEDELPEEVRAVHAAVRTPLSPFPPFPPPLPPPN